MKKLIKIMFTTTVIFAIMLAIVNMCMNYVYDTPRNHIQNVSLNRIKNDIDKFEEEHNTACNLKQLQNYTGEDYTKISGVSLIDIDNINGVTQNKDSEYLIYKGDMGYYMISYDASADNHRTQIVVMNIIVIVLYVITMAILTYILFSIIRPFNKLSTLPYELSKGNLTVPLKENQGKAFGKFIWGMDLLRENLEANKVRELELVREKKVLLLSLSHDIKTPLSAIKLYSKALSSNLYKDENKKIEVAKSIDAKVDEIEGYISEIVKASNEDFLTFDVDSKEIYCDGVFNNISEYYTDKMKLNLIDFSVAKYSNSIIRADEKRLVEVIQNVVENAIKYGDNKKIWIETNKNEEEYNIVVRNTGCRLEKKELPHIFDSFFRGSNVGKKPGSGLGLYICRQIMHLMEGEITAAIEEGNIMAVTVTVRMA